LKALVVGGFGGHAGQAFAIAYWLKELGSPPDVLTVKGTEGRFRGVAEEVISTEQPVPVGEARPSLRRLLKALIDSLKIKKYDVVILNGSNFALVPGITQKLKGAKVVNVEVIDAVVKPTRAAKLASAFSDLNALHWEEQKAAYPKRSKVFGPVHEPRLYDPYDGGYVLVTAGSLGYEELFDAAAQAFGERAVLQTGKVPPEKYEGKVREAFSFSFEFHKWLAGASAVVTTFPGSTAAVAALAYGKPTVLVINPHLKRGASPENAVPYARKIGAVLSDLKGLREAVERAKGVLKPSYPEGAKELARYLLSSFL